MQTQTDRHTDRHTDTQASTGTQRIADRCNGGRRRGRDVIHKIELGHKRTKRLPRMRWRGAAKGEHRMGA